MKHKVREGRGRREGGRKERREGGREEGRKEKTSNLPFGIHSDIMKLGGQLVFGLPMAFQFS